MVKANVDRILEVLRQKKSSSVGDLSSILKLKQDDVQKSAEYLEQDGKIRIEHKWPRVVLTLINENKSQETELPLPPKQESTMPQRSPQFTQDNQAIKDPVSYRDVEKPQPPSFIEPQNNMQQQPLQMQEKPIPQQQSPTNLYNQGIQTSVKPQVIQPQNNLQHPQPPIKPISQQSSQPNINNQGSQTHVKPQVIQPQNNLQQPSLQIQAKQVPQQFSPPNFQNTNYQASQNTFSQPRDDEIRASDNQKYQPTTYPSQSSSLPPPPRPKTLAFPSNESRQSIFQVPIQEVLESNERLGQEINYQVDEDPLNPEKPHFNLDIPSPSDGGMSPIFLRNEEFSSNIRETPSLGIIDFPSNITNDIEKIEYLLDRLDMSLNNHAYDNLNNFYRNIYNLYMSSEDIRPNEKAMISERINEIFEKIKYLYTVEEIV
jgi:hypothetical protein